VEAETKLKTEVTRIKKKLQIQITELEMSLDVANKNNIELQKTIKKQSLTLTVSMSNHVTLQFSLTQSEVYLIYWYTASWLNPRLPVTGSH
jgi:LPS O-antigen subunit length determinant protein (WzzB/FepE family)